MNVIGSCRDTNHQHILEMAHACFGLNLNI